MSGKLIVFEGIDGSGKTTVAKNVVNKLNEMGIKTVYMREPANNRFGNEIKERLKNGDILTFDEQLYLFLLDRAAHVQNQIEPYLKAGYIIILDRYYYSTAAYQACYKYRPKEILVMNILELNFPQPDLTLWFYLDPEEAIKRINNRGNDCVVFEEIKVLKKVHENYEDAFQSQLIEEPIIRISAEKEQNEVFEITLNKILEFLRK